MNQNLRKSHGCENHPGRSGRWFRHQSLAAVQKALSQTPDVLTAMFSCKSYMRTILHVIREYDFKQVIPNIRAYGLRTFINNAFREFSNPVVSYRVQRNKKTLISPDSTAENQIKRVSSRHGGASSMPATTSSHETWAADYVYVQDRIRVTENGCRNVETSKPAKIGSSNREIQQTWETDKIDKLKDVRLVSFYLPQFHPIPENDRWWGKGFTEWRNVAKARPNFTGHYQPRLPADLGYYDLRVAEIMDEQAELAKKYCLHGFCYYYYWFGGKRLLEMPLERLLATNKPDMPFCLCWANENWSRRWDGRSQDILIKQAHSDDDDRAVMLDMMRYMKHPNYIRVNGKPLLLIYRINLFPDIKRTVEIWRELCLKEGLGDIYLAMVESFEHALSGDFPPRFGFNASVEFPPHGTFAPIPIPGELINERFRGSVNDYRELALKYITRSIPGHKRFRTVLTSWDNTPRRQNDPTIFHYSTPGAYEAWLEFIIQQTCEQNSGDERIVFINAWNEWSEGAYLEPDQRFGHGYLEATCNAFKGHQSQKSKINGFARAKQQATA